MNLKECFLICLKRVKSVFMSIAHMGKQMQLYDSFRYTRCFTHDFEYFDSKVRSPCAAQELNVTYLHTKPLKIKKGFGFHHRKGKSIILVTNSYCFLIVFRCYFFTWTCRRNPNSVKGNIIQDIQLACEQWVIY